MSAPVLLKNIETARRRLVGIIRPTPLMQSATLARMLDADVRIKPENAQKTGKTHDFVPKTKNGTNLRGVVKGRADYILWCIGAECRRQSLGRRAEALPAKSGNMPGRRCLWLIF